MITNLEDILLVYSEPVLKDEQQDTFGHSFSASYTTRYSQLELPTVLFSPTDIEVIFVNDSGGQSGDWWDVKIAKLKNGTFFIEHNHSDYTFSGTSFVFSNDLEDFYYFALTDEDRENYNDVLLPMVEKLELEKSITNNHTSHKIMKL